MVVTSRGGGAGRFGKIHSRLWRRLWELTPFGAASRVRRLERVYREYLYLNRGSVGSVPLKAQRWLKELLGLVSREIQRHPERSPTYTDFFDPEDAQTTLLYGETRQATLKDGPQKLWLSVSAEKSPRGYRPVEVIDGPPMLAALIAFVSALEAREVDTDGLRAVGLLLESYLAGEDSVAIYDRVLEEQGSEEKALAMLQNFRPQELFYVRSLLRFFRPRFEERSPKERLALELAACDRVNGFLRELRKLLAFLEYGEVDRDTRTAMEEAARDVRAALMADVEGLNSVQIGRELGMKPSQSDKQKGGHSAASKAISRGRAVLKSAWSEE